VNSPRNGRDPEQRRKNRIHESKPTVVVSTRSPGIAIPAVCHDILDVGGRELAIWGSGRARRDGSFVLHPLLGTSARRASPVATNAPGLIEGQRSAGALKLLSMSPPLPHRFFKLELSAQKRITYRA